MSAPTSGTARIAVVASAAQLLPRRADFRAMLHRPGRNIAAGLTVAIVALPLALAFGASSGLGAQAGVVTAVVAGAVAALLGGSNLQVSGPTGAMTVVLIPIVHRFGATAVLLVGLLAGLILVGMALARLGRFVRLLPAPLIEGFTLGIAAVITLQQLPHALGVAPGDGERMWQVAAEAVADFAPSPQLLAPTIAIGVAAVILLGARWRPVWPLSLAAVALASAATAALHWEVPVIGALPPVARTPSADFFDWGLVQAVAPAALAVAALAALESLLCATVADAMSVNERHDPDRELFGQGVANIAVPFFGGVPATAAIARTAVNVRAGATSRLASFSHAGFLLLAALVAAPLVGHIPLAALAGVLFATTLRMAERTSIMAILRSTRGDAAVLLLTFAVTVALDLVTAVVVGLALAGVHGLRQVARAAQMEQVPLELGDFAEEEHALLREHIVAYRLDGPLFFAAAHQFLLELTTVADVRVLILRMSRVSALDATGARVLGDAISRLEGRGIAVLLSGISAKHDAVLRTLGVADHLRAQGLVFPDTPAAIAHARGLLGGAVGTDPADATAAR